MQMFTYVGHSCRVVFGPGQVTTLFGEIDRLGAKRVMFCCTPSQQEKVTQLVAAASPMAIRFTASPGWQ